MLDIGKIMQHYVAGLGIQPQTDNVRYFLVAACDVKLHFLEDLEQWFNVLNNIGRQLTFYGSVSIKRYWSQDFEFRELQYQPNKWCKRSEGICRKYYNRNGCTHNEQ